MAILAPDGASGDIDKLNASARAGTVVHEDVVRRHKDGRLIDVSVSVAPMYDDAGNLVGISAIISDIGERRARERHIEFLMREVSHRSKNLLAVVQAIAGQTARHSPSLEEFQARFSQRIAAMARSQDLLVERNWTGASMADLVRTQLAPFAEDASSRIEVTGPRAGAQAQRRAQPHAGPARACHQRRQVRRPVGARRPRRHRLGDRRSRRRRRRGSA